MTTLIGTCTKHGVEGFEETSTYNSMLIGCAREDCDDHILYTDMHFQAVVKKNNKENIGKHYNKVLDMAVTEGYDTVILMHDDVKMDDLGWTEKLQEAFKDNDIVGLAGATQAQIKEPALWHLMSNQNDWSGAVAHKTGDGKQFVTNFGPVPNRCVIMDGLFLAIKVSSLKPEVRFDENLPAIAHHYDLDFCLQANKHGLKLTTWPIWVRHDSPGLGDVNQEFLDSQSYFLNKWTSKS